MYSEYTVVVLIDKYQECVYFHYLFDFNFNLKSNFDVIIIDLFEFKTILLFWKKLFFYLIINILIKQKYYSHINQN